MPRNRLLPPLAAWTLAACSASAALVFSDNFESELIGTSYPDATNNTAQGDGVSAFGGWAEIEGGDTADLVNDAILGKSLSLIDIDDRPSVAAGFPSQTLAPGDTITLSFDFNIVASGGLPSTSYLRFGFWNTGSLGAHGTGSSYWVAVSSVDGALGLYESSSPGVDFGTIDTTGALVGAGGLAPNTQFSAIFSINKNSAGAILSSEILDSAGDTVFSLAGFDTSFDTFNAIGFRINETSGGDTVRIDNVLVDSTAAVPEYSTYALLVGSGALALVVLRRRSRN